MSLQVKIALLASLTAMAFVCHAALSMLAPKLGLLKLNFKKKMIPASYGIYVSCYAMAGCGAAAVLGKSDGVKLYMPVIFAMSALGLADDMFGARDVGGFAGHFKKLLLEGKVTTGAIKAIGGGLVALAAGFYAADWKVPEGLLNGAVIALSTNTLNLLDLRPGRAAGAFFLGLVIAFAASGFSFDTPWPVAAVLVPAVIFYLRDSKALAMMGDSGSNMLGAVLGLVFVMETPLMAKLVWLFVIAAIHVYSEKHSITRLIERNAVLRWIDRRLGER